MKPILAWFKQRGWTPFDYQVEVWGAYRAGESGLVHAPTGVGKTLAVWLGPVAEALREQACAAPARKRRVPLRADTAGVDTAGAPIVTKRQAARRRDAAEPIRVLWLTPLRALAADTVAALREPLANLPLHWTVESRTADTPQSLKLRQRERLPSALVTTPESLSLLLSYAQTRERVASLRCVVVDEWHELLGTKRGVQTELALARLRAWLPGLRVWGLSATLGNLAQACDVLHGGRGARLVESKLAKDFAVETVIPDALERFPWSGHLGTRLVQRVAGAIESAASTLLFTNTRSQAELWFRALTLHRPEWLGQLALHHGSLDRDLRSRVENLLKRGELRAVVCTSSLDLGVDFSPVDQVIQLGSPKGIARLLQRAGRSGHQPGARSRVLCVPTHSFELVEFAAARENLARRAVEAREPLEKPMDVLAQHLVTIACGGGFEEQSLLAEVRGSYAYRDLSSEEWGWALDFVTRGGTALAAYPNYARLMLRDGRYVPASAQIERRHRLNVGTIPSTDTMSVRMLGNGRALGTIEESFIARLRDGDAFVFAGRLLELALVRDMTAYVRPARAKSGVVPRWNGSRFPLSTQLAAAVRRTLQNGLAAGPNQPELAAFAPLLRLQCAWSAVPEADELLIEHTQTREGEHWFVYPFEGRLVHEGLAALVAYRLSRRRPLTLHLSANDYGFELLSEYPLELGETDWSGLLRAENLVEDLLACVNCTQMARRQFRDIARVAGLVVTGYPGQRRTGRQLQASSELFFDVLSEFDASSLLLEQARREVLAQQLEVNRMLAALERLQAQRLRMLRTATLTPLSFPLYAETLRAQHVSSEKWSQRVRRMAVQLEARADGRADSPGAPERRRDAAGRTEPAGQGRAVDAARHAKPAAARSRRRLTAPRKGSWRARY